MESEKDVVDGQPAQSETGELVLRSYVDARRRAEENEAVYRSVLATAADPIILISDSGMILEVNPATEKLFGYSIDELVGNNVSMLMPEPYRHEHDGYLSRYIETGEARIIGIGREVEAMHADGSVFPIALAVSEVQGPEVRMFTGIIHDMSTQKQAEIDLRMANEELEERVGARTRELERSLVELARSNRDLEQFAYIASHDLQAPLRNVRQGLELLEEHLDDIVGERFDDEARELQSLVVDAISRMESLISGLLSYSRLQRTSSADAEVDLKVIAEEVIEDLGVDIDAAGATVTVDGDLPVVVGDRVQLFQLIQNLVQNAIKYRSGGSAPNVRIAAVESDGEQLVAVIDDGVGIDPALHDRIFELFRRGHANYPGVGMGLAICQRIVERHGGRIWVDSAPGEGAVFTFSIPKRRL